MEMNDSKTHTQASSVVINEKSLANGNSQSNHHQQQQEEKCWDRAAPIQLSRMNSMECWDYTIELECLNGPQG